MRYWMKIQDYFEQSNDNKGITHIELKPTNEKLEGNELIVEGYLKLKYLNAKAFPQINKITIRDCPRLETIEYNSGLDKVSIENEHGIEWRCILLTAGFFSVSIFITYLVYRKLKERTK